MGDGGDPRRALRGPAHGDPYWQWVLSLPLRLRLLLAKRADLVAAGLWPAPVGLVTCACFPRRAAPEGTERARGPPPPAVIPTSTAERLLRLMVMTEKPVKRYSLERLDELATEEAAPLKLRMMPVGQKWKREETT